MSGPSLLRMMDILERLTDASDPRPLGDHARDLGLPLSSAHRLSSLLVQAGLLCRVRRGAYLPGPRLIALAEGIDVRETLRQLARPLLRKLSKALGCTAHLGILEDQMVTYLVREGRDARVFSREGMQLEAYCSAIGKVLLASLPGDSLAAYLAEGSFVALTPHTKVDPAAIAAELALVRTENFARDMEEIGEGLHCIAVPVRGTRGRTRAAISVSRYDWNPDASQVAAVVAAMHSCARDLGMQIGGMARGGHDLA